MWETNSLIHYLIMLEESKPNTSKIRLKTLVLLVNTHLNNLVDFLLFMQEAQSIWFI